MAKEKSAQIMMPLSQYGPCMVGKLYACFWVQKKTQLFSYSRSPFSPGDLVGKLHNY